MKRIKHDLTLEVAGFKVRITGTSTIERVEPKPKEKRIPQSPEAIFVASLFNRQPTTEWSEKEVKAFSDAKVHLTADNMDLIGVYYKSQRSQKEGIHRRDLLTFLNNLGGECDRARAAKLQPSHFNGTHRQPASESTRSLGTKNEGVAASYAGVGKVRTQP